MPEYPNPKLRTIPPPPAAPPPEPGPAYAELDVVTNFSFLRGASHPDELVYRAAELGYRAIAVTDHNSLAGVVRMHEAARQAGVKLVVGCRLVLADGPDVLVWASDRAAYARLCRLLTTGKRRAEKGECLLSLDDVLDQDAGGLLAALAPADPVEPAAERALRLLRQALGDRLSLAVSLSYAGNDRSRLRDLAALGRAYDVPLLATNAVHYHDPGRRPLQDVLTCVRAGCTVHDAGYRLFPNAERYLKTPAQMHRLFAGCPQAIRRALEVAERCPFTLDELRYEYPDELVPEGQTAAQYLRALTESGAAGRYPAGIPRRVREQIEHELALIGKLRYEAYFLTVHDLVRYARGRGILCQGRGSAANSAVCYCLGVTSVDPATTDLLFERFVSAARGEPPDIDIDFEHERREEVIQYVYEKYGRDRAGMTAEVITYRGRSAVRDVGKALGLSLDMVDQMAKRLDWWHRGTMTPEQLRDVGLDPADRTVRLVVELTGQLLGFPRHLSQHVGGMVMTRGPLCEMVPIENASMPDRTVIEWDKDDIDAVGILKVDVLALGMLTCISKCFRLVDDIRRGEPRVRPSSSLCRGEACLRPPAPLDNPNGRANTRFAPTRPPVPPENPDKWANTRFAPTDAPQDTEEGRTQGSPLQLHTIPPGDPAVYDMIGRADTIGVFQIESRAQMSMLPRLRPRSFYDLVIEVAIVRPGPIQGDMVHPYLRRRAGEEPVTYPSEALRNILKKTLGVPLFQEQAMKLVMVAAGFTADEADELRRAMAAWKRSSGLERFHDKVVNGMLDRGYTRAFAEQCFHQIKGFGEYGFPESHAASFAHLVYVSAWLKCHHPAAFAAALLNSQPMGFYAPAQIVRDAKEHGVEVRPGDVNFGGWDCVLEPRRGDACVSPTCALRLGLRLIKGLPIAHAQRIEAARAAGGPFASVRQLQRRTGLPRRTLERLAEADAFASLGLSRREALWQVLALDDADAPLFDLIDKETQRGDTETATPASSPCLPLSPSPCLSSHLPPMPLGQEVLTDYATAGLSLKQHPVALVRPELTRRKVITAAELQNTPHGRWVRVAGLVLIRQRPGTALGIVFETLEDETGVVNLIVRPDVYDRYRAAARHAALVQADGHVERQGEVVHVMARRLEDLSELLEGYSARSRDFH